MYNMFIYSRKCYYLLFHTLFAFVLYVAAIHVAKPVFITPLHIEPEPLITWSDCLKQLPRNTYIGYTPHIWPIPTIMRRAAAILKREIFSRDSEEDLDSTFLSSLKRNKKFDKKASAVWIIFTQYDEMANLWKFTIRSTQRGRYEVAKASNYYPNSHYRTGFMAIQLAVSHSILTNRLQRDKRLRFENRLKFWWPEWYWSYWRSTTEYPHTYTHYGTPRYAVTLSAMPISFLVDKDKRKDVVSFILPCFTLALLPPVLDTVALVVYETGLSYKRSLRIRSVDYSSIYLSWFTYAIMTATPVCLLGGLALIVIFRVHLVFTMMLLMAYLSVMTMVALMMAMYHNKAWISCLWCAVITFVMWYPAQKLIHYKYDDEQEWIFKLMRVFIPPLGLGYVFNSLATLSTGKTGQDEITNKDLAVTISSWLMLTLFYFVVLMVMQKRVRSKVIGGQVPYKDIFFKLCQRVSKLRPTKAPTGKEREKLEDVDEHVAKAISFRDVSKAVSGKPVLKNITLDVYRGEFTMFFVDQIQEQMVHTIDDLLTGLAHSDEGSIYVMGFEMNPGKNMMNSSHLLGYCHWSDLFIDDLTVEEHLIMYIEISLWQESRQYIIEYGHMRKRRLLAECNLKKVKTTLVKNINLYYRAQLCWAIALLLEPWIVIIPPFVDHPDFVNVIRDKIMNYKKYLTIVNYCFTSVQLEYADRVFVFDSKVLAFGGTPAYMFYKYGQGYCVRLTLGISEEEDEVKERAGLNKLISRAEKSGATVGAQNGSLLMLRIPITPTKSASALIQELSRSAKSYNITSMNVTVADSEEIYKRAVDETRTEMKEQEVETITLGVDQQEILSRLVAPRHWETQSLLFNLLNRLVGPQLRTIGWKVFSFHLRYKLLFLIFASIAAYGVGNHLGKAFEALLSKKEKAEAKEKLIKNDLLTLESLPGKTIVVLRTAANGTEKLVADLFTLTEPGATAEDIATITYTSFLNNESLVEYLATRAVESPHDYLKWYAYGLETTFSHWYHRVNLKVLYNTGNEDTATGARALAKAYTTIIRYYTKVYNSTIEITDDPLYYDLIPRIDASKPPVIPQILLILCIIHVTFIPSKEHGLIKHMQSHATNFSPIQYWVTLFFCDMVIYCFLMIIMTVSLMYFMHYEAPQDDFYFRDLLVVPVVLILYGVTSIPQAYLFSLLGLGFALNAGIYITVSLIFADATVLAAEYFKDSFSITFLVLSFVPQFNFIYAIIKIKKIFLYNGECISYMAQDLCNENPVYKCCKTCGILERCFKRKSYLGFEGILPEIISMGISTGAYIAALLMFEYRIFGRLWSKLSNSMSSAPQKISAKKPLSEGCIKERDNVLEKMKEIQAFFKPKELNPFGECIIANKVSKIDAGFYTCDKVYLGLAKGEALALSGLKQHGRLDLCDIMAGYDSPYSGTAWSMSSYRSDTQPHMYSINISYSNGNDCVPTWMKVKDSLQLIALLRGVPRKYVWEEVYHYIVALELTEKANKLVYRITPEERRKVNFAAAVIGAPPIVVLDEFAASQPSSVRTAMYYILYYLKRRKHGLFISASDVESQLPLADKLAIIVDGAIYDVDTVENLEKRYCHNVYTVMIEFDREMDDDTVNNMIGKFFGSFTINDASEVLVNVQISGDLNWGAIFQKMEQLKAGNPQVSSYVITTLSIGYIYASILNNARGNKTAFSLLRDFFCWCLKTKEMSSATRSKLVPFKQQYDVTKVNTLPWSGIFQTW